MKIDNKFLIFKTQEGFIKKYNQVPKTSIVFIKDKGLIWTHDLYFGLSTGLEKAKGYFDTEADLRRKYPNPEIGDWAIIASAIVDGEEKQWVVARCITKGVWGLTAQTYDKESFDLSEYVKKEDLDLSQFITNADLSDFVHKGDINLNLYATKNELYSALLQIIGNSRILVDSELSSTSTNPVLNKVITEELAKKLEEVDLLNYVKTEDVTDLLNTDISGILATLRLKADKEELYDALANKADTSDLVAIQSVLSTKANVSDLLTILTLLGDKAAKSELAAYDAALLLKADKSELSNYALKSEVGTVVNNYVTEITQAAEKAKGYFDTYTELTLAVPNPTVGDWAVVNVNGTWIIYRCITDGTWTLTQLEYQQEAIDLSTYAKLTDLTGFLTNYDLANYVTNSELSNYVLATTLGQYARTSDIALLYATKLELSNGLESKLNTLISGSNIKTINGQSLLGQGNITVTTDYQYVDDELDDAKEELQTLINALIAQLSTIKEKYISWLGDQENSQGGGNSSHLPVNSSNMVTLSEEEYQALVAADEVDLNTYYFTYNAADYPEHTTWTFGGTFPITFTEQWAFGGTFPINLQ